jgi:O-antigen/teichoic acid export membrane protein
MTDKNLGKTGAGPREQSPIITNSVFSAGRLIFGAAAGLASSAVIARSLGKFEMGRYAYAVWITSLLVSIAHGGIPTTLTRFVAEAAGRGTGYSAPKLVVRLLAWQVVFALLVCLVACVVLGFVRTSDRVLYLLAIASVLPQALLQATIGALAGIQRFGKIALLSSVGALLNLGAVLTAAVMHCATVGMLAAVAIASILTVATGLWALRSVLDFRTQIIGRNIAKTEPGIMSRIGRFSVVVWCLVLLDMVVWDRSEIFFLKHYMAITEVAAYSIAYTLAIQVWQAANTVSSNLAPMAAEAIGGGEPERAAQVFYRGVRYVHAILIPACIFGIGLCQPVILMLYGRQFASAVIVAQILLAVPVLMTLTEVATATIYAFEKQTGWMLVLLPSALLNIVLAWLLVPRQGAVGAALASVVAQACDTGISLWWTSRIYRTGISLKSVLRVWGVAACAAAPAIITTLHARGIILPLTLSAGGAGFFLFSLWKAGDLGDHEVKAIGEAFAAFAKRLRPS